MNNEKKIFVNLKPFFRAFKIFVVLVFGIMIIAAISGSLSDKYKWMQSTKDLR